MSHNVSRRDALRIALISGAAPFVCATEAGAAQADTSKGPPPLNLTLEEQQAPNLTAYHYGGQVLYRWNNIVVASYSANPLQKYPYFSNLSGPLSGLPLTTESSVPFPHHRGVWLGCEPLNDGDYWKDSELEKGQIQTSDLRLGKVTDKSAEVCHCSKWVRKDAPSPFVDKRCMNFQVYSNKIHLIDFDITLTAQDDVSIAKAKHSFFALRSAPDICPDGGGVLINSAGEKGTKATYGKPANWCGFHGQRLHRPDVVEGIAVMNHPDNPWKDCPWFTRDYGHLSPAPFNFLDQPWKLAKGDSIRIRYRVVMHVGTPSEAGLDRIYKEWVTT